MASLVTIAEAKHHANIDPSGDAAFDAKQDTYIQLLLNAIEVATVQILGQALSEYDATATPSPLDAIKAAMLLQFGELYKNRELSSAQQRIYNDRAYWNLLHPFRVNLGI
ncbi:head-tail connector protein [Herbaspirillum sp. GCM10030257]|uniref:head-tail connector protein n=1 Tax=Herbaspirillum sp. GCM10030257 TaxID=3273393 RepID=UPI003616EEF3